LKPSREDRSRRVGESPSPRKAWIETRRDSILPADVRSPSPRKAWIETSPVALAQCAPPSPSPRKAWIETPDARCLRPSAPGRLPPGRRGLKPGCGDRSRCVSESPSPRKAWIETRRIFRRRDQALVAFPPEGVD